MRIYMRGGQVLNSKTEYSRCRLPRLTIDRNEWEERSLRERQEQEEELARNGTETQEEERMSMQGGAVWELGIKSTNTKRKQLEDDFGRRKKKRKLDVLTDWGGPLSEEEEGIRKWLTTTERQEEDIRIRGEVDEDVEVVPAVQVAKTQQSIKLFTKTASEMVSRMVQEWVDFVLVGEAWRRLRDNQEVREVQDDGRVLLEMDTPLHMPVSSEYEVQTGQAEKKVGPAKKTKKEPKRKGLAALAAKNKKMTGWLTITKKVSGKLISTGEAEDAAGSIVNVLMESAWKQCRVNGIWRSMDDDIDIKNLILSRIVEEEAKKKEEKMEAEKQKRLRRKLAAETRWKTRWMIKDVVEDIVMEVRRTGVAPEWLEHERCPDRMEVDEMEMEVDVVPEFRKVQMMDRKSIICTEVRIIQEQTESAVEEVSEAKEQEDAINKLTSEVEDMAMLNREGADVNKGCKDYNVKFAQVGLHEDGAGYGETAQGGGDDDREACADEADSGNILKKPKKPKPKNR